MYGFQCTDFHDSYLFKVSEQLFTNTAFDRQLFVQNSHTDIHGNTIDSSAHRKTYRQTWSPYMAWRPFYCVKDF